MNEKLAVGAALGVSAAGVALYGGQYPTAQLFGATICRNPAAGRKLCLTYDDGPNPAETPRLLKILERYDAHATFFSIGQWAHREPALLREMHAAGHAIGNHTYTHPRMPFRTSKQIVEEMNRCRDAVEAADVQFTTVDEGMLMRPPYGTRRPGTLRTVRSLGYVPVTWSITCYDWRKTANERKVAKRAARAGEGDVILLHDGSNADPRANRSHSVAATEDTLAKFSAEGYEFVTIPQLVSASG